MAGIVHDTPPPEAPSESSDRAAASGDPLGLSRLSEEHIHILREVVAALNTIRYGSIILTIHEGRLVELSKTVRVRTRHQR